MFQHNNANRRDPYRGLLLGRDCGVAWMKVMSDSSCATRTEAQQKIQRPSVHEQPTKHNDSNDPL